MTNKVSIKAIARRETREDAKIRKTMQSNKSFTEDSFVNFEQKMGIGADNALSSAGYGFNPISRIRTLLEWIHRGSWIGGVAVDVVADDMTKMGVTMQGKIKPKDQEALEESLVTLGIWNRINETIKWSRLYGGCLAVMLIDGQASHTPLRLETIGEGQFKGLLVLDRWMVEPTMNDLVTQLGPDLGLPKFYNVTADAPALPRMKIHYSRCLRLDGVKLPYWQRVMENLWGTSVLERLYDRMVAFDSATTGAAQLVYKSYLRTYKIKNLREVVSQGGPQMTGLVKYMEMMRKFQSIEGITILDGEDEFEAHSHSSFAGLSDALTQFGQQLSGALQIPLVRLFGQSPTGFNSGDTDIRMYYDNIKQLQEKDLRVGVTRIYRAVAQSEGVKLPEGFRLEFNSLWQLEEKEKSEIAEGDCRSVIAANEAGLLSDKAAMQELRQSGHTTGRFTNITDKDINSADDVAAPDPGMEGEGMEEVSPDTKLKPESNKDAGPDKPKPKKATKDHIKAIADMLRFHDLPVAIENPKGSVRTGPNWKAIMPADYGYIMRTTGADLDQVDCYVGDTRDSPRVWVVNQNDPKTGVFDEHKCMLGFGSMRDAINTYCDGYMDGSGPDRIGSVQELQMDVFKEWLATADLAQPCVP